MGDGLRWYKVDEGGLVKFKGPPLTVCKGHFHRGVTGHAKDYNLVKKLMPSCFRRA